MNVNILDVTNNDQSVRFMDSAIRILSEEQDNDFRNSLLKNHWHKMARIDLPRLRFSEELALAHEHDLKEIVNKLNYYDCKGSMIVKHLRENGA